ncbi:MAG: outer rane efflux protein [Geminicoccaceae bacterium]|nr:outer rane efflux protein [Geminicoccaceae bacterium]
MTIRRTTLGFLVAVAPALGAQATPQPAARPQTTITFDEAVRIALRQNTTLQQAANAAELDEAAVRQQRFNLLPDLRLTSNTGQNYGRSFSEEEGRIIDETTRSMNAGVQSSVTIFNGFSNIASLRAAQLARDAGELDVKRAEQTVAFTVASNFLALVQQQEQLRVQRENLAAEEAQERQIQAFVDAGSRPISDLYQQQATVAAARATVVNANRAFELAKVDIIQTLQLDPRGDYTFAPPALDTTARAAVRTLNLDSLLTRALAQRTDLDAQETLVGAAGQDVRAAKGGRWPSLSLSAGYNTAFNSATEVGFVDQLDQRRGGSIGFGLSIPLWDRGSAGVATQRAQISEDNARLTLKDRQQQVGLEVRRAYLDYQAAIQQLEAAEAQLRAASLALEAAQQRYNVGAATLLEVTQARAAQTQAASALISARYGLLFQRTAIGYYVGDLNPRAASIG